MMGKVVHAFNTSLDRVRASLWSKYWRHRHFLSSATSVSRPTNFLRRCGRWAEDDLRLVTPRPFSPKQQQITKENDEGDVRRARALLDHCRALLPKEVHALFVLVLADLGTLCKPGSNFQDPRRLIDHLRSALEYLQPWPPLWEEFIALLTPAQARQLHVFVPFARLHRVAQLQRILSEHIPAGKRVWFRLRKLANAAEEEWAPEFSRKQRSRRGRQPRHFRRKSKTKKSMAEMTSNAWSLLETSLRYRHVLLAHSAALLDANHRPYSNFPQAFEVLDALSRKPDTAPASSNKLVCFSGPRGAPLPRLITEGDETVTTFTDKLRWEVSWELVSSLSTMVGDNRLSKSNTARNCQCPCHDSSCPVFKPAKVDSLGLRHCIKCSLRVNQGVVYVDECNFHLAHVEITWPPNFTPLSASESLTSHDCYHVPLPTISATPSAPSFQRSTRHVLVSLAAGLEGGGSMWPVPDMARRQICVEFSSSSHGRKSVDINTTTSPTLTEQKLNRDSGGCGSEDAVQVEDADDDDSTSSLLAEHSRSGILVDFPDNLYYDDAACFNTEAFSRHVNKGVSESDKVDNDADLNDYCVSGTIRTGNTLANQPIDDDDDDVDKDPDFVPDDLDDEPMDEIYVGEYKDEQSGYIDNVFNNQVMDDVECDFDSEKVVDYFCDKAEGSPDTKKIKFPEDDDGDTPICEADCDEIDKNSDKNGNNDCSYFDDETLCEPNGDPEESRGFDNVGKNRCDAECSGGSLDLDNLNCKPVGLINNIGSDDTAVELSDHRWSIDEDRRLLEYCRAAGKVSLGLLGRLAAVWPERSMEELGTRFNYLMRIALGEDYVSDICNSSLEDKEEESE